MKLSLKKPRAVVLKPDQPRPRPVIDFPRQDETVASRQYSVRLTVDERIDAVDVSIDQGPWLTCRQASGHWWYDWTDFDAGEHEVIARARQGDGRWTVSVPTEFTVV